MHAIIRRLLFQFELKKIMPWKGRFYGIITYICFWNNVDNGTTHEFAIKRKIQYTACCIFMQNSIHKSKKNTYFRLDDSRTCLVFIMYQFIYNPRVKSIKMLIFFENPLIPSSIHIYTPPLFSLLQIQWKPRPVLTRTQSKSIKILIFLFTPIFFLNPCY